MNDVKLFGRIVGEASNIDNMTFLEVDTRYFDRYILAIATRSLPIEFVPFTIFTNRWFALFFHKSYHSIKHLFSLFLITEISVFVNLTDGFFD